MVLEIAIHVKYQCLIEDHNPNHLDIQYFERVGSSQINIVHLDTSSHVRLISTRRLYFKRVISIKMRICWARESTHLGWVDLNENNMLSI